jgi:lysophospholipase L1-like esterase
MVIMLGTNALKPFLGRTAMEASKGAARLVEIVRAHCGAAMPIVLVAPPHLSDTQHPEMLLHFGGQPAIDESRQFAKWYRQRAEELGTAFFDASTVARPDPNDGVHLDAANTRAIGDALVPIVAGLLGP